MCAHARARTHTRTHPHGAADSQNSMATHHTLLDRLQICWKEDQACQAVTLLLTVHAKFTHGHKVVILPQLARSVHLSSIPFFPLHPSGCPRPALLLPHSLSLRPSRPSLPSFHPSFLPLFRFPPPVFLFACCPPHPHLSAPSLIFAFLIRLPPPPPPLPLFPVLHPSPLNNSLEDSSPPSGNKQVGE